MQRPALPDRTPFTTAEACRLGYSCKDLSRLVERRVIRRLFTAVYIRRDAPLTSEARLAAARLVMGREEVLCDRTAAWVWGVDTFGFAELDTTPPLESYTLRHHRATDRSGCDGGSRDLVPEDWCVVQGVRVTTPLRTALDLACNLPRRDALAALDALARRHDFTSDDLARLLPRFRGRRGVVQARQLVPLVDPRAESAAESWVRAVLDEWGLPTPEPQHWVLVDGVPTYRLDLAYPRARIAIEYDGEEFHTSEEDRKRDRVRRDWLRAHGWHVIVLTKDSFSAAALDAWLAELTVVLAERTRSHKRY